MEAFLSPGCTVLGVEAYRHSFPTVHAQYLFDNLHSLHDVVSDILASPTVPVAKKRAMLLAAAAEYRDPTIDATTIEASREMAREMGVDDMGGLGTTAEIDTAAKLSCPRP